METSTMKHNRIRLSKWSQTLRPYQEKALKVALQTKQGSMLLLTSPTGTGKGTMQLALLKALRAQGKKAWIVTPSIEVLRGYLERCGASPEDLDGGSQKLARLGRKIFVTTPVRLRNMLRGRIVWKNGKRFRSTLRPPEVLIVDEAHHATEDTIAGGGLREFCKNTTFVGFTATPYRSTPDETGELLKTWGPAVQVLSIQEAVECGAWALPSWKCVPIINDDHCGIVAGEIDADEATLTAAAPLANLVASLDLSVPTCVTVSTSKAAIQLHDTLQASGVDSRIVLSTTATTDRAEAYDRVKRGGSVLISVRVLGEGVDLPWLRRWVDASPTLSPVAFLQKLGRITRPHPSGQPEYVGTCRNLERHGYLLQGKVPRSVIRELQEKMGGSSKRAPRIGMLKGVGALKPIELPLEGGVKGTLWALWLPSESGGSGFERAVLLDPTSEEVISCVRSIDPTTKEGKDKWGKWEREATPPGKLVGFKARGLFGKCSPAQAKFWSRHALNYGLDPSAEAKRAQFYGLQVLREAQSALRPGGKPMRPVRTQERAPERAEETSPAAPAPSDDLLSSLQALLGDLLK